MTNPWKNMDTAAVYNALLKKDAGEALKDLAAAKRAFELSGERQRIKAGHKLMNEFHKTVMRLVRDYQEDYNENYLAELRHLPDADLMDNFCTPALIALIKNYMEYCCD